MENMSATGSLIMEKNCVRCLSYAIAFRKDFETVINVVIGDGEVLLIKSSHLPEECCACEKARGSHCSAVAQCAIGVAVARIITRETQIGMTRGEVVEPEDHARVLCASV